MTVVTKDGKTHDGLDYVAVIDGTAYFRTEAGELLRFPREFIEAWNPKESRDCSDRKFPLR